MADPETTGRPDGIDLNDARPRRWGWLLLIFGFGSLLTWALIAPLDAGVSTSGSVVIAGSRKAVQPLVAGKVTHILVKEGDTVSAGQVVVRLDDTSSRAQLEVAKVQWLVGLATEGRLLAESTRSSAPEYSAALIAERSDPRAVAAISLQSQLFTTRRNSLTSDITAMTESMRGLAAQAESTEASRSAKDYQLRLLKEQLVNMRELAKDGYLARNRVLDQERAVSGLEGAISDDTGMIGHYRQSIAEAKARIIGREQDFRKDVELQLADTQRDLAALRSKMDGLQFDLASTVIAAPATGVVMNLGIHTVGGVVSAGSPLMEIVPKGEPLQIEAQIPPHLIDKVKAGLAVDILFPAFSQVVTPRVPGKVASVSADVLADPKQAVPYFKALVEVTPEGMSKLQFHEIRVGMPTEVFVRTGERTAMNYLLKPLLDRLSRALTEP